MYIITQYLAESTTILAFVHIFVVSFDAPLFEDWKTELVFVYAEVSNALFNCAVSIRAHSARRISLIRHPYLVWVVVEGDIVVVIYREFEVVIKVFLTKAAENGGFLVEVSFVRSKCHNLITLSIN